MDKRFGDLRFDRGTFKAAIPYAAGALAVGAAIFGPGQLTDMTYGGERAQSYVEQSGYTDVHQTDIDTTLVGLRGCGESDFAQYEFEATAPSGANINIAVCKGILKGATLRQK